MNHTSHMACLWFLSLLRKVFTIRIVLFQQVPKDVNAVDLKNPKEMSYVFSGAYTPISCKLIEQVSTLPTDNNKTSIKISSVFLHSDRALQFLLAMLLGEKHDVTTCVVLVVFLILQRESFSPP